MVNQNLVLWVHQPGTTLTMSIVVTQSQVPRYRGNPGLEAPKQSKDEKSTALTDFVRAVTRIQVPRYLRSILS